jgi:hypothetical protein
LDLPLDIFHKKIGSLSMPEDVGLIAGALGGGPQQSQSLVPQQYGSPQEGQGVAPEFWRTMAYQLAAALDPQGFGGRLAQAGQGWEQAGILGGERERQLNDLQQGLGPQGNMEQVQNPAATTAGGQLMANAATPKPIQAAPALTKEMRAGETQNPFVVALRRLEGMQR